MYRRRFPLAVLSLLVVSALACAGFGVDADATATALAGLIAASDTPGGQAPTTEADAGQSSVVLTAEANATAAALNASGTQTAIAEQAAADQAATAAVEQPYLERLPAYGLDASQGELAWIHPPEVLDIEGYLQYDYVNRRIATVAQDFLLESDITWNTFTGISGCGFAVRASGNEESFTGYLALVSRGTTGRVGFAVIEDNEPVAGDEVYARGIDRSFEWQNDTTNRVAIVARGNTFAVYTNGVEIGVFSAPDDYIYERGFVAMVGLSESGKTHCEFADTWLWLIDPGAAGAPPSAGTVVGKPPAPVGPPAGGIQFPPGLLCGLPFLPPCP